jgi:hypothetical protein
MPNASRRGTEEREFACLPLGPLPATQPWPAGVYEDVAASADPGQRELECVDKVCDVSEPQVAGAAARRLERASGAHEPNCTSHCSRVSDMNRRVRLRSTSRVANKRNGKCRKLTRCREARAQGRSDAANGSAFPCVAQPKG